MGKILKKLLKPKYELNREVLSPEQIMELETIFDDFAKHDPEGMAEQAERYLDAKREDGEL